MLNEGLVIPSLTRKNLPELVPPKAGVGKRRCSFFNKFYLYGRSSNGPPAALCAAMRAGRTSHLRTEFRGRLMVGHRPLKPIILVRVQAPEFCS